MNVDYEKIEKTWMTPKKKSTSKTIIMFKCNTILKPETREQIRQHLKKQVDEGVLVLDGQFEWPQLIRLPEGCDYDIVVETLEEENER